ncbi:MAG: HAMP domain-containing histidine kinase [Verrucomicrobiae bacterium]|nr:HAMP domain-containing histidine kinase [Verrucomicrobiae bacterium]
MADSDSANSFTFADHLVLDDSPTRDFYKSVMQGLIHKNNNILGVIQGFSSLVLMDDVNPEIRENVEQMRDSAGIASNLAKVILTASGCSRVTPERINPGDLLPHLEDTARQLCEASGVTLQFNARPNLPPILADTNRLSELVSELIKNAVEAAAAQPDGEVAVDVLPPGEASPAEDGCVDFFIRNSSEDLTPEKLREAFAPFTGNKGNAHFGLGLTTAAVLAGQMKMRLGLRSSGGTTTAWLSMPVAR